AEQIEMGERVERQSPVMTRPVIAQRHRRRSDNEAVNGHNEYQRGEAQHHDVEGQVEHRVTLSVAEICYSRATEGYPMAKTLFDKIWDTHLVARRMDGRELIYIDRHVLHELHAPHAFEKLAQARRRVARPDLTFSVQDHTVPTQPGRNDNTNPIST